MLDKELTPILPIPNMRPNPLWLKVLHTNFPEYVSDKNDVMTFNPEYSMGLSGNNVQLVFETCFPSAGNRDKRAKLQALQCALLSLSQCVLFGSKGYLLGFLHKRSTSRRKGLNRYKDRLYSDQVFASVLDVLEEYGFVKHFAGFKGAGYPKGLTSLWLVREPFINWLVEHQETLNVIEFVADKELVILKDAKKSLLDYSDTVEIKAMRERLLLGNKLRSSYTWSYAPLDRDVFTINARHRGKSKKDYTHYVENDKRQVIRPSDLMCQRSFRDNFETGGRFYCNAQSLSKYERNTLNVNGSATIEIDLKSLHPRLLYNMNGLEAPLDCYQSDTPENRKLSKHICMLVLNCKSEKEAKKALMYDCPIDSQEATSAIESFINMHSAIRHEFFQEGWKRLQYLDSVITDKVIYECLKEGFPVLPIHDSYIASTEHAYKLLDIIESAYQQVTGFKPEVSMGDTNDDADRLVDELLHKNHGLGLIDCDF